MQVAHRWLDRNLTRLELIVALIMIMLVLGSFTRYMLLVFARAEMSMVNSSIINLNTSLKYHAAMAVLRGDKAQLSRMEGMNPMAEVQSWQDGYTQIEEEMELITLTSALPIFTRPLNYIGELNDPDLDIIARGEWYFDIDDRSLNYRVVNGQFFFAGMQEAATIKFTVNIDYIDKDADGHYNPQNDEFVSINVQRVRLN